MILPIVSSLIFSNKRRRVIEAIPPSFRELWKEWDLRLTVMLSLVLQIILVFLGHRRKYKQSPLIRGVVWSAYLAADSTAIFALGILSNNLTDIFYEQARSLDANTELTAFWAPFLLLHLGGPDTITAYSLEDNELWPRHLVGLVVQTIITFYVFLLVWKGSPLSILFILMFFAGLIKYGERNYVLRSASDEKFRESIFSPPQFGPKDTDLFKREENLKTRARKSLRMSVREVVVPDNQLSVDLSVFASNKSLSDEKKLLTADRFLKLITKRFFFDKILSSRDRDRTRSVFRNMSFQNAFEVVETELGLIYDLLYTKALLLSTPWGLALRGITFFVTCSVLVVFTFLGHKKNSYSKIDLIITFLLLIVAVILDAYSAVLLLLSDQFFVWLSKRKRSCYIFEAFTTCRESRKRWSGQISQWSQLRSFEKPPPCLTILKLLRLDKMLEKRSHVAHKVPEGIKKLIFRFTKATMRMQTDRRRIRMEMDWMRKELRRMELRTKEMERKEMEMEKEEMEMRKKEIEMEMRTMEMEEEKIEEDRNSFVVVPTAQGKTSSKNWEETPNNILFWHIVTEVSYNLDKGKKQFDEIVEHCKLIKHISRYMGYLLLKYPSLLSLGADKISLHKTIDQAIQELRRAADEIWKEDQTENDLDHRGRKTQAYEKLVKFEPPVEETSRGWNQELYDALKFADSIRYEEVLTEKWNRIGFIWLDMLLEAARGSTGREHAQQLRRGGEFFTHVWLLMAHFGLTDHFDSSSDRNVDRLIAKHKQGGGEMIP